MATSSSGHPMRGEVGFPNRQAGEAIRRPDDQRRYRPCRTARQPCAAFPIAGHAQRCTPGLATELELPRPPLHKPKSPGSPSRPAGGELPWSKRDHSAQTRCRRAVPGAKSPRKTAWRGQHPDPNRLRRLARHQHGCGRLSNPLG